ncbi:hypothetical protein [Qipengyuania gelatinilytica]|uniref:Lipoprotein n=1 Tax=Qipengyuania gelatinilytica TaxID=2867231 RepID=A0ABX8ZYR4_9SPHN|nr:hypothetical protein [Qipengyuania gelatinilytica]QZD93916.1 hypothetical protein K3136_07265 [Qipengyuania gelatinilytica]
MIARSLVLAISALSLAACNAGPNPRDRYGRFLQPVAQPSKVVATELAFARAAQEDGQWTAFLEYAADGALIFGRNGAIEAKPWLKTLEDPAAAVSWQPHRLWSSCDGSIAVTQGAFEDPEGQVGTFNTVWQRQRDGDYKYVFDFGFPQDVAPEAPELIQTAVAACEKSVDVGEPDSTIPLKLSRDGSLAWGFQLVGEGERRYVVWLVTDAGWEQVVNIAQPAGAAE